jgi:hypothetical protein
VALALILSLTWVGGLAAKTLESAKGENIFFYATNREGKAVLLDIIPLGDLKKIAHGQGDGSNYYISSTDNYPTTQYVEARGVTVPELVDYAKSRTVVRGASALGFAGGDTIRLMATDSYGNYNRSWTYDQLYGVKRYYFEGLFNAWHTGWEIGGEDNSKFGLTLDDYNGKYRAGDPYYDDKRAVFAGGVVTLPILATESFSGRTTADALNASTEIGIASYIAQNGGVAAGSLRRVLADTWSLRLSLPMTEADLMAAHRTAFDNFKWIYNLKLDMAAPPDLPSLGTVAEPVAAVAVAGAGSGGQGDALTISLSCPTPGARIYYSFDGAPQIPYTGPVTVSIAGRDTAADPVTFYMTAVREGWDDAGVITAKYPGLAPTFQTVYSAMAGEPLVFQSQGDAADWADWAKALTFITLKAPADKGYVRLAPDKYSRNDAGKSITFDASLFAGTGSYSFVFHAAGYADKTASLTVKKPAPPILTGEKPTVGQALTFSFSDGDFQNGLLLYVTPPGGESAMIAANWLERGTPGQLSLKEAYFASESRVIRAAGAYKFSFVNNSYQPGTVDLTVELAAGEGAAALFCADVTPANWYYDAAAYVMGEGLFDLRDGDKFAGGEPMTRGALMTAFYRLAGGPAVGEAAARASFADVPADTAFAPVIAWAAAAGIAAGYEDNTFRPERGVTREEIAALFYRYAAYSGADITARGDLSVYADSAAISPGARKVMAWANGARLINDAGGGRIDPKGVATRAQAARIMLSFRAWAGQPAAGGTQP